MKYLVMFFVVASLCGGPVFASEANLYERQLKEEQAVLPSCNQLFREKELCKKVREAQARAGQIPLRIFELVERQLSKSGKPLVTRSVRREVGLIALNPADGSEHEIIFDMPIVGDAVFQPNVRTEHNPSYEVRRTKGTTYVRMGYDVKMGDQELLVLAAAHLSIPEGISASDISALRKRAEKKVYLATPPHLAGKEFAEAGQKFVLQGIERARQDLREKMVESRAYPGELVADKSPPQVAQMLIASEHTDMCLFQKHDPGCDYLILKNPFLRDEQVVDAVFAQFFWDGYAAFSDSCSDQDACGVAQFTNTPSVKNGVRFPGTYDSLRRLYPKAELDSNFRRGTKSFENSIKALILLVDSDLASKRIPDWVRVAFVEDYRLGAPFPAMSYFGGPPESRNLVTLIGEFQKLRGVTQLHFDTFPWQEFTQWVEEKNLAVKKGRNLVLGRKTLGYLRKCVMFLQRRSVLIRPRGAEMY